MPPLLRRCVTSAWTTARRTKTSKPKITKNSSNDATVQSKWYAPGKPLSTDRDMGRYGLKRIAYHTVKPPTWQLPPHPPSKTWADRFVYPLTLASIAGMGIWVYLNPEEDDMTEYWKKVESGQILLDDDDDDDDDDFDDDDDDDEDWEDEKETAAAKRR
eukprot:CAMPEP_0198134350 /NCGR_PEP_ID=MMETSP1442-20131203/60028_1 /TAXON_ID= /ORGANISM="Craspedostauros australis, Strain CCMP3328" /LENGTH=158 /DNA_ID=CAMNT_0043795493 /DNA_START=177 /DNA_END=653 /DNA_ORIENTATION=+